VKAACIARHRGEYPVRLMCRVVELSPAAYYAAVKTGPSLSAHARRDAQLLFHIRTCYRASRQTYGAPRVQRELRDLGLSVGTKRVARLMRQEGLVARTPRRYVHTTDAAHAHPIAPNLLARTFGIDAGPGVCPGVCAVNRAWVSDITYVPTREGWLYLAAVLDLGSRRVIGWAMRETLEGELALSALQMALEARRPEPGLLHHSDRGVQYACGAYRDLLAQHGVRASMSRKGDCWDNAVAESFFATVEWELLMPNDFQTRNEARHAIFEYIERWYNPKRRHSTLGYVSPARYEAQLRKSA
jgi:putative transposase